MVLIDCYARRSNGELELTDTIPTNDRTEADMMLFLLCQQAKEDRSGMFGYYGVYDEDKFLFSQQVM